MEAGICKYDVKVLEVLSREHTILSMPDLEDTDHTEELEFDPIKAPSHFPVRPIHNAVAVCRRSLCTVRNIQHEARRNPPASSLTPGSAHARHDDVFSKNSFASFTLVARYGLPPRSGWLSSISVRWAFLTFSLVTARSL